MGLMQVSQQHLRDMYPALFSDLRNSRNRTIDPLERVSPFVQSFGELENCEEATVLLRSTLCDTCTCFSCQSNPILESCLQDLRYAISIGDPLQVDAEIKRSMGLLNAFGEIQGSLRRDSGLRPRWYSCFKWKGLGMSPPVDSLVRGYALRFMPSMIDKPEDIFEFLRTIYLTAGNDIMAVRRLVEDLRTNEKMMLYLFAYPMAMNGDILGEKIVRILQDQPADITDVLRLLGIRI